MNTIHAYAATSAKSPLEPFSYDPGELKSEEVEIKVTHCGLCHSDLSMLDFCFIAVVTCLNHASLQ